MATTPERIKIEVNLTLTEASRLLLDEINATAAALRDAAQTARAEQREIDAQIVDDSSNQLQILAQNADLTEVEAADANEAVQMFRRTAAVIREARR